MYGYRTGMKGDSGMKGNKSIYSLYTLLYPFNFEPCKYITYFKN